MNGSTDLTARDVSVQRIAVAPDCGVSCAAAGIVSFPESSSTFERFEVREASVAGVQMLGGKLLLTDGVIASSGIGVHHWSWVDPTSAMERVWLDSNGVDDHAGEAAVPEWPSEGTPD